MSQKETESAIKRNQMGEALSRVQPVHISYCNTVLWWEAHQTTSEVASHSKILALCDSVFLLLLKQESNIPTLLSLAQILDLPSQCMYLRVV